MTTQSKVLKGLMLVGFGIIAAITAMVSYHHMQVEIATKTNELYLFSFILPLSMDGAILVGAVQIRTLKTLRVKWYKKVHKHAFPILLVVYGLFGSLWANLMSADLSSRISIFWAISPVVLLFLSIEVILGQTVSSAPSRPKATSETKTTKSTKFSDLSDAQKKAIRSEAAKRAVATKKENAAIKQLQDITS